MPDLPDDWVPIFAAFVGFAGVVSTMLIAWLSRLNQRLRRLEHRDRLSWLYIRALINHAYTHAPGIPLPEPPEGWLDGTE